MKRFLIGILLLVGSARAQELMGLSETEVIALIPQQSPIDAPDPVAKTYLREVKKDWLWKPSAPDKIISPLDGTVYPNAAFPMDQRATYLNYLGESVTVPYYLGPKPSGDLRGNPTPERYFFNGAIDNRKFQWLRANLPGLVALYLETGDPAMARRIALVLDGFAQRYKHYLLSDGRGINNYYISTGGPYLKDGKPQGTPGIDRPYSWTGGRLNGPWLGEIQRWIIDAYAAIKDSEGLQSLSADRGVDVGKRIEDELIRAMVDFVMDMPWSHQMGNNLVGYLAHVAEAGKVIGEPEYVHTAYRYLTEVMLQYGKDGPHSAGYTYDLHHPEGNQGHYGVMRGIYQIYRAVEGYSDPPGYRGKKDGKRLENVSLEKDLPLFERMIYVPYAYTLPNGAVNPLNDTIGYGPIGESGTGITSRPLVKSRSQLLPGLGHAVLGAGSGDQQVQVQLQFSEQGANHNHKDCMSLVWFAHGKEMSGDIGYQRNKLRQWSAHALSHNTVVVGRLDQNGGDAFGNVQYFESNLPGLAAIQVNSPGAYREQGVIKYQRTIILNSVDVARPYFIDIFEVEGGQLHDYAMHGAVQGGMKSGTDLALEKMAQQRPLIAAGERWIEPDGFSALNVYGLFTNVSHASVAHPFYVDFSYGEGQPGTRIHLLVDREMDFYLGETPALRPAGQYNDAAVYNWSMPHFILRNRGGSSRFVAVYDLHPGAPSISQISGTLAKLTIQLGERSDQYQFADDLLSFTHSVSVPGKTTLDYAINETIQRGSLLGGSRKLGGYATDSFIADSPLNLDLADEVKNRWLIVEHPGVDVTHAYQMKTLHKKGGFAEIELTHDSGLNIGSAETEEVFSPWRTFEGDHQFRLNLSRCSMARPEIFPTTGPWDRLEPQQFVPFMDTIEVQIKGEGIVGYTLDGKEVLRYEKPFVLDCSAVVSAVIAVPNPIMPLPRAEQRFVAALDPVELSDPEPGLQLTYSENNVPQERRVGHVFPVAMGLNTFSGYLKVEEAGIYTFYLQARHDARLRIGELDLLDTTGLGPYKTWSVRVPLRAGYHAIELSYNQTKGPFDPELNLSYAPPRETKIRIPDSALFTIAPQP